MRKLLYLLLLVASLQIASCEREPELHLYDSADIDINLPFVELALEAYWNYEMIYGVEYDWRNEWYYGWDETDLQIFGEIGYTKPTVFNLRRYYTLEEPLTPHTNVINEVVYTNSFKGKYDWGYWDILVWSDIETPDGVQSINFDEATTLDSVFAYTNQSMNPTRYQINRRNTSSQAPRYNHTFYQPEQLFSAYEQAIEIDQSLEGFEYDSLRNVWVKKLGMMLEPITYIYLTQVILHHNNGRVTGIDGITNLSGLARSTNVNTARAGDDAVTVEYSSRLKTGCRKGSEPVDIIGGRILTFGICGLIPREVRKAEDVVDDYRHYLDVNMQFNNGMDSIFVFDVTDQVRHRFKGGVITIELDMDTVPIPTRRGGSGFDAVVKEYEDGGTHEFSM